jgi:hypothetical protein
MNKKDYEEIGQQMPVGKVEKLFIAEMFTVPRDRIITHLSISAEEDI